LVSLFSGKKLNCCHQISSFKAKNARNSIFSVGRKGAGERRGRVKGEKKTGEGRKKKGKKRRKEMRPLPIEI